MQIIKVKVTRITEYDDYGIKDTNCERKNQLVWDFSETIFTNCPEIKI